MEYLNLGNTGVKVSRLLARSEDLIPALELGLAATAAYSGKPAIFQTSQNLHLLKGIETDHEILRLPESH